MKRNFEDLVVDSQKNNQGRPQKLSVRKKRNILQQTKFSQEEMGNFCVKRAIVKIGIPPFINKERVDKVY